MVGMRKLFAQIKATKNGVHSMQKRKTRTKQDFSNYSKVKQNFVSLHSKKAEIVSSIHLFKFLALKIN